MQGLRGWVERGQRRVQHDPTTPEAMAIEGLPVVLDRERVLAEQRLA
jgi:hypothetical protein